MEIMHIEGRYRGKISTEGIEIHSLGKRVALFTTVQFMDIISQVKGYLEKNGKIVELPKTNATYNGQVLGCTIDKIEGYDCILYIGDGKFHPIALALENEVPVFTYNPFTNHFTRIGDNDIQNMQRKKKAGIAKFHASKKIGLLVSTKPGQYNEVKEKLNKKYPDKKFYTLLFDTIDPAMLENFNFIDCYVNTACPRISFDDYSKFAKKIVEYRYLL